MTMKTIGWLCGLLLCMQAEARNAGGRTDSLDSDGISPRISAFGDPLVATDALGRTLPDYDEAGPEKPDRYVGLFYWLWHGPLRNDTDTFDISRALEKDPERTEWPFLAYYWGEPEAGYYRSSDEYVLRKHLDLFCLLGIDFLYLDFTNLVIDSDELHLLLRLIREMKRDGYDPPRLVPFFNTDPIPKIEEFYRDFFLDPANEDCWFVLDGKPLVLSPQRPLSCREIDEAFTWRRMWAGRDADGFWHYFDDYPQTPAYRPDGRPEQIVVSAGKGAPLWDYHIYGSKSSTKDSVPVYDRYWTTSRSGEGLFFEEQWQEAYRIAPLILCVTGWNEWKAEAWPATDDLVAAGITFQGRKLEKGEAYFVDEFNAEFNRDLEPLKGGYSDNYFYQLAAHIRRYKGMRPPPEASPSKKIRIDGNFDEWRQVSPRFDDFVGELRLRDSEGAPPGIRYTDRTARNDIAETRVTYDRKYIYFYVRTAERTTSWQDSCWMMLYIDADRDKRTGWEGYDFVVHREIVSPEETTLKKRTPEGNWETVARCAYRQKGCEMEIAVPRSALDMLSAPDFHFHWVDNVPSTDDIEAFFTHGESAPERRYDYRYKAK